jgi:hypothetical protein
MLQHSYCTLNAMCPFQESVETWAWRPPIVRTETRNSFEYTLAVTTTD